MATFDEIVGADDFIDDGNGRCVVCEIVAVWMRGAEDDDATHEDSYADICTRMHPGRIAGSAGDARS